VIVAQAVIDDSNSWPDSSTTKNAARARVASPCLAVLRERYGRRLVVEQHPLRREWRRTTSCSS